MPIRLELQYFPVLRQGYRIEFPSVSSLAVLHAEPVSLIPEAGYTFSDDALHIIGDLAAPSGLGPVQFIKWIASGRSPSHYRILLFLDRSYHMAHHIWAIRETWDEIAMTSYLGPKSHVNVAENPPPAGLLYVADVPTFAALAQRSPFLGQLLPISFFSSFGVMPGCCKLDFKSPLGSFSGSTFLIARCPSLLVLQHLHFPPFPPVQPCQGSKPRSHHQVGHPLPSRVSRTLNSSSIWPAFPRHSRPDRVTSLAVWLDSRFSLSLARI